MKEEGGGGALMYVYVLEHIQCVPRAPLREV